MEKKNKLVSRGMFFILVVVAIVASVYPASHPESTRDWDSGTIAWLLTAAGLVLIMTPGLSFFYGGMVRAKNVVSTMLQSFIALGVVSIFWYAFGFSLAFGDSIGGWIGNPLSFAFFNDVGTAAHPRIASGIPFILFAAFQLKFAIITPALFTGSMAERLQFWSYVVMMVLFSLLVYCPLAHWTWHPDGVLYTHGVLDFAGGTVVHISAGIMALVGAWYLGPRKVKELVDPSEINVPYVILGTGLLWFGWFGFNAGSALAADSLAVKAFVNTHFASAAAMIGWVLYDVMMGRKPTALGACIGAVVGLVAITPAAGFVSYGPSLIIGLSAALVSNVVVERFKRSSVDDTLDVFACHGLGGMIGMLLTGVYAEEGGWVTTGNPTLFLKHLGALVFVVVFVGVSSYIILRVVDRMIPMRVSDSEEKEGLDRAIHGEAILKTA
ncbi:ammonium transporter [Cryomorphaceae bacterium]|nr:ammonium transporter [Cryomorphaceae bacterium]